MCMNTNKKDTTDQISNGVGWFLIRTIRHNSLYRLSVNTVIGAKVVIHFQVSIGKLRIYLPHLSKFNLPNYTVSRP
jgi:hypothetical protein